MSDIENGNEPIHMEFNKIALTRSQLQVYDQYLRQTSGMINSLIHSLHYIQQLIDNHIEQNRGVMIGMNTRNVIYQECSMLPYGNHEIDVWKSLDTFIKDCNEFMSSNVMKIHNDLRSEDYYGQLPYNFKYLQSIRST